MSNQDPVIEFIDNAILEIKLFIKDSIYNLLTLVSFITFIATISATPTTSMYPTIKKGDWFILLKCMYGFNFHSFDMGPFGINHNYFWKNIFTYIIQKKFLQFRKFTPGDVISFRADSDLTTGFLKRIIAVEGQTVQLIEGVVHIDGKPLPRKFLRSKIAIEKNSKYRFLYYEETSSSGKKYITRYIKNMEYHSHNNTLKIKVPKGFIFAMGDNRDKSDDSRQSIGLVPVTNISGKGFLIFFSKSSKLSLFTLDLMTMFKSIIELPFKIKWKRIFTFL